jgi:hypothetical protein
MRRLVEFLRSCTRPVSALGEMFLAVQDTVPRTGLGTNRTFAFLDVPFLIANSGSDVVSFDSGGR